MDAGPPAARLQQPACYAHSTARDGNSYPHGRRYAYNGAGDTDSDEVPTRLAEAGKVLDD